MATASLANESAAPSSAPRSAESVVLDELDRYLAETENALSIPYSALNQAISDVVDLNGKAIKRITERILRETDKHAVATDNALEAITTGLLGGVDSWLGDTEYLLRDLASRGGLIGPGDPLTQALIQEVTHAPELEFSATLLLAAKDAIGKFGQLIEVLREIRDRLPAVEVRLPGEAASGVKDEETYQVNGTAEADEADIEVWPELAVED